MDKPVLDEASIGDAISAGRTPVVQFWKPDYDPVLLERLDALCQRHGPRLGVRFYGHAGGAFDAGVLRRLPSVQNLAIDRLERVVNEDAIGALRHLRRFSFGVATLDRPDFLSWLDLANIEVLKLAETKRRNFDLGPLARATRLRDLFLEGHRKGIDCLAELPRLERLHLFSQPKDQPLGFVAGVRALRVLEISLGGRETLAGLSHDTLEILKIVRIQGLCDLGPMGRFQRLKGLSVHDQIRLRSIDLAGAPLKFLSFYNCKSLAELTAFESLNALGELSIVDTALPLDALRDHSWPPSLTVLHLHGKSKKWNEATRKQLDARGLGGRGGRWFTSDLDTVE